MRVPPTDRNSVNLADFAARADGVVEMGERVLPTYRTTEFGYEYDSALYAAFRASGLSFLENTFGTSHPYCREFERHTAEAYTMNIKAGMGVLRAAREEVTGGWAVTARGLVSAEIFADFLEMADHLLTQGYKDPAAVVLGSVLEEHIRKLAQKNSIPIEVPDKNGVLVPKKAEVLNADLHKAGVYNLLQQKSVTAWLDLRNKAAHGKYAEYSVEQVQLMLAGLQVFLPAHPL